MSITLKNISKKFDKKTVISDFSYAFNDRGIYALVGPSGVGKTTLLRIISGIDKKFTGEVVMPDDISISIAFQEHRLFPNLTALENLTDIIFAKPTESDVSNAKNELKILGFSDLDMQLYPHELSGGMKQRVSLARAFLKNAKILILDEPTKELDSKLVKTVLERIKDISKSALVIMVSHSDEDVEYLGASKVKLTHVDQ